MRVTYKDLETKSYSQLIKEGATKEQLLNKVSNYYLKEQRVLTINENEGKTLSRAIKLLKRGNVSQGIWIHDTQLEQTKQDVSFLKKASKIVKGEGFASKILNEYQTGQINPYQLNHIMYKYSQNPAQYEKEEDVDEIDILVEGFNT